MGLQLTPAHLSAIPADDLYPAYGDTYDTIGALIDDGYRRRLAAAAGTAKT